MKQESFIRSFYVAFFTVLFLLQNKFLDIVVCFENSLFSACGESTQLVQCRFTRGNQSKARVSRGNPLKRRERWNLNYRIRHSLNIVFNFIVLYFMNILGVCCAGLILLTSKVKHEKRITPLASFCHHSSSWSYNLTK